MTLQAKLTLGSVLLATLIVGLISTVDLRNVMQLEFEFTLERAEMVKRLATSEVIDTLNRQLKSVPSREAVRDRQLNDKLLKLLTSSPAIIEIAMVSADEKEILASTVQHGIGPINNPPDFAPLVNRAGWFEQLRLLVRRDAQSYKVQEALGAGNVPSLHVRVIIDPTLIRNDRELKRTFTQNAKIATFSVAGAVFITFLFS